MTDEYKDLRQKLDKIKGIENKKIMVDSHTMTRLLEQRDNYKYALSVLTFYPESAKEKYGKFVKDIVNGALYGTFVPPLLAHSELANLIVGMTVSVDVSTGDEDADHRLFGTVTEVVESAVEKNEMVLLVHDTKTNF